MTAEKWGPGGGNGPQPNVPKSWSQQIKEKLDREELPPDPLAPRPNAECVICGVGPCTAENGLRDRDTGALAHKEICADQYRRVKLEIAEARKIESERRQVEAMQSCFLRCLDKLYEQLPRFRPCVGTPEFEKAVRHAKFRAIAAKYTTSRHLLLLGPSGSGKTATAIAIVQRLGAEIAAAPEVVTERGYDMYTGSDSRQRYSLGCLASFLWTTGFDVAMVRRNSPLGSEPELLKQAKSASLLVVDDCGSEPLADNVLFEIVNERYTSQRPTIVTTGLCRNDFVERYGAALDRRLTEQGIGIPVEIPGPSKPGLTVVKS